MARLKKGATWPHAYHQHYPRPIHAVAIGVHAPAEGPSSTGRGRERAGQSFNGHVSVWEFLT